MKHKARAAVWIGLIAGLLVDSAVAAEPVAPSLHAHAHLCRPVAAGLLDGGRLLATANQRSGTMSLVDLKAGKAIGEVAIGKSLSGLAVLPDGKRLLVTDEQAHDLIAISYREGKLAVEARRATTPFPVSVAISADGRRTTVAGLWSRQLQVVDLAGLENSKEPSLFVEHSIRLPFPPRLQFMVPDSPRVIVADAFGGTLAVVDYVAGKVIAIHEIEGHNLRGLALSASGKELLISHQILDQKRPVTESFISQNLLLRNVVRRLPLAQVLDAKPLPREAGVTIRLDDGWIHGAADPAGLVTLGEKGLAVALAGSNMLALVDASDKVDSRINVGSRPTLLLRESGGELVVVNTLSDTISIVDPAGEKIQREIPLGPAPNLTSRDRGEVLFYDGTLSVHGWLTCHSCHTDGHTSSLLADTSGDSSFGAPKRTLSLLGVAQTGRWAWNGDVPELSAQVRKSLQTTMHNGWFASENVADLTEYLRTLSPPPPLEPARSDLADWEQLARGGKLFSERGCVKCHSPEKNYTSSDAYDVGLADELGKKKFNPPSLRGVSQGKRFFHDNRAASLEAVFTEHGHGLETELAPGKLADLLRFLRSL